MASYYSNTATYQQGGTAQVRADVSYSRSGTTGYNVTVTVYQTTTKSWCPYYAYSCYQYCSINGTEKRNTTSVNPNASWTTQVQLWSVTQFVDPGGPEYSCPFYVEYGVPSGTYTFSSYKTFTISSSITLPSTYVMTTQTFTTSSNNTTAGDNSQTTNASYTSQSWANDTTASYAGDSFTYIWDKNNEANVGVNANPSSLARLCRTSSSAYDASYTNLYSAWNETAGSGDLYQTYTRTATVDDCNNYLQARIWKYYKDGSGNTKHNIQSNGHFIKAAPSVSGSASLRSLRFYTDTASCKVWQINSYSTSNNGYGMVMDNSVGNTGSTTVSTKFQCQLSNGGSLTNSSGWYWGSGAFNANYSLPTALSVHSTKVAVSGSNPVKPLMYTNWYNPRTGATSRLGYKSIDLASGPISIVSGSVTLPTIDSIVPSSGNGTTIIVDDTKRIWTNQDNVKITYRVNHSGNKTGFGYDARINENSGTYASTTGTGAALVPVQINLWSGDYGILNNTNDTVTLQHDSTTTAGSSRSIAIVPYITDGDGYKIFGAANTTNGLVTSTPYTVYKISKPGVPTVSKWANTLPAIDGVKDVINYTVTSPSSWGNVTDFSKGYKMRYKIGVDTTHSDGWEWSFINTPTTTSTAFSGSFTETYDRDTYTQSQMQICATSYYSTVWDAYLDFQSDYSAVKSFDIAAKDPYAATSGTLTTSNSTTLLTEVPFTFQCPSETINGNTLSQITTLIIDGSTEVELVNPTYDTTTPNSLTGALTLSFDALNDSTPTLVRGAHTIQVKNEVATYFDSETPVTNHVYFGTTTVSSNVLDIEVAELPSRPTLDPADPAYHYAGSEKTLTFTFSPNDWGCLDTTHNNRHYDYQLINPSGTVISSGTIAKANTSWSYTFTPTSPDYDGVYIFKLRETTVVGSSDWVSTTVEIFPAIEPSDSTISSTDTIALENWDWTLTIKPGDNGTYLPVSTSPVTRYKIDVLKAVEDANGNITGYEEIGRIIQDWVAVANGTTITKTFNTDLDGYEDGLYRLRVQYERNYTTKTIHEEKIIDIIPPAVELYNNSYIDTCTHDSDIIKYQIKLETFAATDISEAWYSLDYGKTWIELPQISKSGATKTHALLLELSWLDVIYFKLHGTNPVADSTDYWIDEMPSSYLVWLSWADRTSSNIYEKLPKAGLSVTTGTSSTGSGDHGSWDTKFGKWAYKASKTVTSNVRGGYLHVENVMENGKMYQIKFKAKSSQERDITVRFESDSSSKTISLDTEYQEYFMNVQFNSSSTYKALTFYTSDWASEEELCIKEIKVCERTAVRNEELVRRIFASLDGGDIKKMRRIEKH